MRISWLRVYVILILILLFVPVLLIVIASFNNNQLTLLPMLPTLRWYEEVMSNRLYISGFKNSTIVAVFASFFAGILGTLAAYGINRYNPPGKQIVLGLLTVPILIPGLVLGIALLSYFTFLGIRLSLLTVILAHIVFSTPYVLLIMNARFHNFDWALEEAARDLGANAYQRFSKVLFPLIRPSIIGSMLLVFAISFDEFVVTYFVIGPGSTMPMIIWSMLKRVVSPALNAISTILLLISLAMLFLAIKVFRIKFEL